MAFYSYEMLRTFQVVAVNLSMTAAASQLNQSKGSVSYQIKKLESQLGFALFKRLNARLHLTPEGQQLLQVSKVSLDQIDQEIESLRYKKKHAPLTIALQTYFLSRWLSPRLMRFTAAHPEIGLRFVPLNFIVEMESIESVLKDIKSLTSKFCYLVIDLQPAVKRLADGRNAHILLAPCEWWITRVAQLFPCIASFPVMHSSGKPQKLVIAATEHRMHLPSMYGFLIKMKLFDFNMTGGPLGGKKPVS